MQLQSMLTIPNLLTFLRILLIPVIVGVFYAPIAHANLIACALFGLAALTDWLDGYLARKLNQTTAFGAFLDPVADKITVAVALTLLVEVHAVWWLTLPAIVIIGREIVISALREWMAEAGQRANVAVSYIGKIKTTAQMIAIALLLAFLPDHKYMWTGLILLYIASLLTLWSMFVYLQAAWLSISENNKAEGE
jgi:CDP-diacylglycerol--glycerol-3-phosphate 3-phosphatidyltransferase